MLFKEATTLAIRWEDGILNKWALLVLDKTICCKLRHFVYDCYSVLINNGGCCLSFPKRNKLVLVRGAKRVKTLLLLKVMC